MNAVAMYLGYLVLAGVGLLLLGLLAFTAVWSSAEIRWFNQREHDEFNPFWRTPRRNQGRQDACGTNESEVNMKGRILLVAGLVVAFAAVSCFTGCTTADDSVINIGDGKLLGLDLSAIDVDVAWVAEDGREFSITQTGDGIDVVASWTDSNGITYSLGDGIGSFTISGPNGLTATIQVDPDQELSAEDQADLEAGEADLEQMEQLTEQAAVG